MIQPYFSTDELRVLATVVLQKPVPEQDQTALKNLRLARLVVGAGPRLRLTSSGVERLLNFL